MQTDISAMLGAPLPLQQDKVTQLSLGPLRLFVERTHAYWQIAHQEQPDDTLLAIDSLDRDDSRLGEGLSWVRFSFAESANNLLAPDDLQDADNRRFAKQAYTESPAAVVLQPRLAPRPVVTRPEFPFRIPPMAAITLYISTPLWLEVHAGTAGHPIAEMPTFGLSDTWYGTPEEGQLCYATRTSCRQDLEGLPNRPNRVMSAVRIRNGSEQLASLERFMLPLPHMRIFLAGARLWTEHLTLDIRQGDDQVHVRREKGPPPGLGAAKQLSPAREDSDDNFMSRAFGSFLR